MAYDVAIIGAGVVGALVARELSRYDLKIVLLEKCNDVAMGATKANSAIVHSGYDAKPGTAKAKFNVEGAAMMAELCGQLSVPYNNNGSLVVAFCEEEMSTLKELYERGIKNGVKELRIAEKDELFSLEPNINNDAVGALVAPTAGIVCPYELTIAATENAVENGVDFRRNCEVKSIDSRNKSLILHTSDGEISTDYIINAAGVYADEIAKMAGDDSFKITARRGEYFLFDKSAGSIVFHTVFQCPTSKGKGVLVTPTVDGNLIIGPTAENTDDKSNVSTSQEGLCEVINKALKSVPTLSKRDAITSFAGLRAHPNNDDFIIGFSSINPRLINAAGIESPGLTAAPAIAKHIGTTLSKHIGNLKNNSGFKPEREAPIRFRYLTDEEMATLIEKDNSFGRIVCRCETITEGEIIAAIRAPAGARDVDGVKRRTRAGMGRCQGGFCGSKVAEILARELNSPITQITKFGGKSKILIGKTK